VSSRPLSGTRRYLQQTSPEFGGVVVFRHAVVLAGVFDTHTVLIECGPDLRRRCKHRSKIVGRDFNNPDWFADTSEKTFTLNQRERAKAFPDEAKDFNLRTGLICAHI
jgi:hypothetical protein